MPALPQDVERNNPALASEFGSVMKNLKQLTTQIAMLDRIHSIKARPTGHLASLATLRKRLRGNTPHSQQLLHSLPAEIWMHTAPTAPQPTAGSC